MLCHGPVRVPENAKPGPAVMRIEMPPTSSFASIPTDLPVELKKPAPRGGR